MNSGEADQTPIESNDEKSNTRSSENRRHSSSSSSQSLLLRLSEACMKHKNYHIKNPDEESNEDENIPKRCEKDLNSLRKIIPRVETGYQLPVENERGRESEKIIEASEILNLCVFYKTIMFGSFCPHSMNIFDNGDLGNEILPRVHQLIRHLTSQSIIKNTFSTLTNRCNVAPNTSSTSQNSHDSNASSNPNPIVADDISFTIANLLNTMNGKRIHQVIIQDMLATLQDLSFLASSRIFSAYTPEKDPTTVKVVIFGETVNLLAKSSSDCQDKDIQDKNTNINKININRESKIFSVEILSLNALISLQNGIMSAIFIFLVLQYQKNIHGGIDCIIDDSDDEEIGSDIIPLYHDSTCLAHFCMDDESRCITLACLRQVLLDKMVTIPPNAYNGPEKTLEHFLEVNLITLRNKVMSANLLYLLLPDLSTCASQNDTLSNLWTELCILVSRTILLHLQSLSESVSCTKTSGKNAGSSNHSLVNAIEVEYISYSSIISVLVRDILLCPIQPYTPTDNAMWTMRSFTIFTLMDCIPHIQFVLSISSSDTLSTSTEKLCTLVLRTVHISLFPTFSKTQHIVSCEKDSRNRWKITQFMKKIYAHCISSGNALFPSLIKLICNSYKMETISIAILARILVIHDSRDDQGMLAILRACQICWNYRKEPPTQQDEIGLENFDDNKMGDSVEFGKKRKRVENISTFEVKNREQRKHNDISLVASISKLLTDAMFHATRLVDATKQSKNDENLKQKSNSVLFIATPSVTATISGTLRLIEIIFMKETEDKLLPATFDAVIECMCILYESLTLISSALCFTSTGGVKERTFQTGRLTRLLDLIIGFAHQSFSIQHNLKHANMGKARKVRECLLTSISNCSMTVWCKGSDFLEISEINELGDFLHSKRSDINSMHKDFTHSVVQTLDKQDLLTVHQRQSQAHRYCRQNCRALKSCFGLPQQTTIFPGDCCCFFLGEKDKNLRNIFGKNDREQRDYLNDCSTLLIEQVLPLHSRCILFACILPISKDDVYSSTFSNLWHLIKRSSSFVPPKGVVASALTCLPIILLSSSWKGIFSKAEINQENRQLIFNFSEGKVRKAALHFVESLNELKIFELFDPYICGSDDEISENLQKLAFDCLILILDIYSIADNFTRSFPKECFDISNGNMCDISSFLSIVLSMNESTLTGISSEYGFLNSVSKQTTHFQTQITKLLISISRKIRTSHSQLRKSKWHFISSCNILSDTDFQNFIEQLPSFLINATDIAEELPATIDISIEIEQPKVSAKDTSMSILTWFLDTPFMDDDEAVRNFTSKYIGPILLNNNCRVLFGIFRNDKSVDKSNIISNLFDKIDQLLYKYCYVDQSQLSFTAAMTLTVQGTQNLCSTENVKENRKKASHQATAVQTIASLCKYTSLDQNCGIQMLEKGVLRLVRFWIASSSKRNDQFSLDSSNFDEFDMNTVSAISYQAIHSIKDRIRALSIQRRDTFIPGLFFEILSHGNSDNGIADSSPSNKAHQFLSYFIQEILLNIDFNHDFDNLNIILTYTEDALPLVISAILIEEDYNTLCACTRFRLYLINELNQFGKEDKKNSIVDGCRQKNVSIRKIKEKQIKDISFHTSTMCLMNIDGMRVLDKVLPKLLLEGKPSSLKFFLKTVLHAEVSLRELLGKRELKILEVLFWELGGAEDVESIDQCSSSETHICSTEFEYNTHIMKALKKFVIFKKEPSTEDSKHFQSLGFDKDDVSGLVEEWIHKHFMMLLVNVVTIRWKRGNIDEKIQSLKCLRVLLRFIRKDDSPKYVTQVLTMVDSAMAFKCELFALSKIRLLAMKALSHFVKIVLTCQVKTVGENLCKIVVSIFPLLHEELNTYMDKYHNQSIEEAVNLLHILAKEKQLKFFFNYVPFLPKHPRLAHVRETLKSNGVNFDNLLLLSSQIPNRKDDDESAKSVQPTYDMRLLNALRQRIQILETLLSHESENVRHAVLLHLTDVLYSNRLLFQDLLRNEDASMQFLTVRKQNTEGRISRDSIASTYEGGSITSLIQSLLASCALESLDENRIALARCLGEIGAIDPNRINQDLLVTDRNSLAMHSRNDWRLELSKPPWKFRSVAVHYKLQLVTKHFVNALRAAPTPTDQHKIAFAIQEVLQMLNNVDNETQPIGTQDDEKSSTLLSDKEKDMNPWLKDKLEKASILDVIEPFWSSKYTQREGSESKTPPFFIEAKSYYAWMTSFGRYLIEKSHQNKRSRFKDLFFSCRSAIRSQAGIGIIEFLLPLLILDSICFGENHVKDSSLTELRNALSVKTDQNIMPKAEHQKSITTVFMVIKTLKAWSDDEIEDRFKSQRSGISLSLEAERYSFSESSDWSADESIAHINDLLNAVPLSLCATASEYVGMHAQSLMFLEMESRQNDVEEVYDGIIKTNVNEEDEMTHKHNHQRKKYEHRYYLNGIDVAMAQRLFGELNDIDSMSALNQFIDKQDLFIDKIYEREANGDWTGVIQAFEQALQVIQAAKNGNLKINDSLLFSEEIKLKLEKAHLRALLELGHLESTINVVQGVVGIDFNQNRVQVERLSTYSKSKTCLLPFAVEASWRLSRWDLLDQLITDSALLGNFNDNVMIDSEGIYQCAFGKVMLGLHHRNKKMLSSALMLARNCVIPSISTAAHESYSRAFPHLIKLHCLKESEDFGNVLTQCTTNQSTDLYSQLAESDWAWNERLDCIGSDMAGSIPILNMRLALARLASESTILEGELWLTMGKKARKGELYHIASNALTHALLFQKKELNLKKDKFLQSNSTEVLLQIAKMKYKTGKSTEALQILEHDDIQSLLIDSDKLQNKMKNESITSQSFARRALLTTEWIVQGGLKSGSEVFLRYQKILEISPKWERSYFCYAKYLDSILSSRMKALASRLNKNIEDESVQVHIFQKDTCSRQYILQAIKNYGEALQLDNKHVFQALPRLLTLWFDLTAIGNDGQASTSELSESQDQANTLVADLIRKIPAMSYYTTLPQLVSRIGHRCDDTVEVVLAILKRILTKYPCQALWSMAWLRHSAHSDRRKKGEIIFKGAQNSLIKNENMELHDLLVASKSLFKFLIELAKYQPKRADKRSFIVKPWCGKRENVELRDFVPPVQAALTINPSAVGKVGSQEAFPSFVPRMRAFNSHVQMMNSKAKPKKITAFAIPSGFHPNKENSDTSDISKNESQPGDIGEMHFLVKQEAKGDLRKDARVQDLNNVINRLLAKGSSSGGYAGRRQRRRLHLRTFSVVCLSEDCGILEWVPNTDSFRSIVGQSYNPQAAHHSLRRRGKRISSFQDATLRNDFTKCQDMYIKNGNLMKAAQMFDNLCLKNYPPLLYWWFIQNFQDPHSWFEARTTFTLSTSVWSAVGHVIGLGDRHSENILVDTSSGECVHVDFDCIFDKGLHLPRPEVVPFRLTPNMIDAFGPIGVEGTFFGGLSTAMNTLRDNRDTLMSVLEPFLKDPVIDWKRQRGQQKGKNNNISMTNRDNSEAKRSIKVIEERLKGIYNLKNPNARKIGRTDGYSVGQDDESANILPLSVDGQVHKMIAEASSHENLVQLYVGWMPWL